MKRLESSIEIEAEGARGGEAVTRVIALAVALLATAGCAHGPAVPAAGAGDPGLERRQAELFDAVAARDADRLAAFFADDAVLHVANMPPVAGRDAIRSFYGNVFRFLDATRAVPETTRVAAAGDMAWGTGRTTNRFRGPDGAVEYEGKYVIVWRRVAGEWRVALYGVSSDHAEGRAVDPDGG